MSVAPNSKRHKPALSLVPDALPLYNLEAELSAIGSMLAFDQFYIMTGGGPGNSTVTMVQVVARDAFTNFQLGTASAVAMVIPAEGPSFGTAPAGTCTWILRSNAFGSTPSCSACERT